MAHSPLGMPSWESRFHRITSRVTTAAITEGYFMIRIILFWRGGHQCWCGHGFPVYNPKHPKKANKTKGQEECHQRMQAKSLEHERKRAMNPSGQRRGGPSARKSVRAKAIFTRRAPANHKPPPQPPRALFIPGVCRS